MPSNWNGKSTKPPALGIRSVLVIVGIIVVIILLASTHHDNTGGSWDTPTTYNPLGAANAAATAKAKGDCEILWSLEKGGPSTYGVSHSDFINSCVRSAP